MLITTQNEIVSLMPTARWDRPEQLLGYLEEEERVALEPLLGTRLYQHLCEEYERLRDKYVDITSTTVKQTGKAKDYPGVAYADVTERLDCIQKGCTQAPCWDDEVEYSEVSPEDMQTIRLLRICQQIEFYKMLSHKAGLLTVSFNEGGGMNLVSADGYEPADDKRMDRVVKDAYMSAGRAVDSLLLFLEADAKGAKQFTEKWKDASAFYLHKDLLFQTARVLNEYLDIKGERMAYVALVRDIRFCQNTYLKPRVGGKLLKEVVEWANNGAMQVVEDETDGNNENDENGVRGENNENNENDGMNESNEDEGREEAMEELLGMLRTALAFYVESRRTELAPVKEKLARRDSMTDAQQAMAMACQWIEDNLDALGDAAVDTPIYNAVRARKEQEERDKASACAAAERRRREACEQSRKKLFTSFPATHRTPELK